MNINLLKSVRGRCIKCKRVVTINTWQQANETWRSCEYGHLQTGELSRPLEVRDLELVGYLN